MFKSKNQPPAGQAVKLQPVQNAFDKRLKKMSALGVGVSALFFGLLALSAFKINIEGAVISSASIVPTGENKLVQHQVGGIVQELLVNNGEMVEAGQPLIVLNSQEVTSEFNVTGFRRIELEAKITRLKASLNDASSYHYQLPIFARSNPEAIQAVRTQSELFTAELEARLSTQRRLNERIGSLTLELAALDTQIATAQEEVGILDQQLRDITPLVAQQLVPKAREWDLKRAQINARSQLDALSVTKVRTETNLSETRNELDQTMRNISQETLRQIEQAETELQAAEQSFHALQAQLTRKVIKAPSSGRVHQLSVYNRDAVIAPGAMIMQIVPQGQGVELIARVDPIDIDQIAKGRKARLRFDGLDANLTPEITGKVTKVSADTVIDEATGFPYYSVTLTADEGELDRLTADLNAAGKSVEIGAGMPVTAMITTEPRTLFSYLAKPIADHSTKAFQ